MMTSAHPDDHNLPNYECCYCSSRAVGAANGRVSGAAVGGANGSVSGVGVGAAISRVSGAGAGGANGKVSDAGVVGVCGSVTGISGGKRNNSGVVDSGGSGSITGAGSGGGNGKAAYMLNGQMAAVGIVDTSRTVLHGQKIKDGFVCIQIIVLPQQMFLLHWFGQCRIILYAQSCKYVYSAEIRSLITFSTCRAMCCNRNCCSLVAG